MRRGRPEIFNSDQGSQFTSERFTGELAAKDIAISMDGRGRCMDNIFIERLWRSLKYEEVYLTDYESVTEARVGIGRYFRFSCASLQGMLESLYKDIDVFILDRGVFDALVWNEWLELTGKITREEAQQVEQFFTMKRWTDLDRCSFRVDLQSRRLHPTRTR